jgi:hypothetical protein
VVDLGDVNGHKEGTMAERDLTAREDRFICLCLAAAAIIVVFIFAFSYS